jgi:DNA polymerase-3 subunit epsilon
LLDQPLVLLDLETTGASAARDRIIEVGLVEIQDGRATEWSTLVNPERHIPAAIQAFTGITDEMVERAPSFPEIADGLRARLEGKLFIAHNARFDYGFLRSEFRRAGRRYASRVLCTVQMSRRLYPQERRHNLDALMARHGIECDARHRGLGDARVLRAVLDVWRREFDPARLSETAASLMRSPVVPAGLPEGMLDEIPEVAGVYVLRGAGDSVLYVGKSANLQTGVSAHFAGGAASERARRISMETRRVEWIETPGRLGAAMEEARLVRELAPVHNRKPCGGDRYAWYWRVQSPSAPPELVRVQEGAQAAGADLFGLFRSRNAALRAMREIAASHALCLVLLGLERPAGPCEARRTGGCRGACEGREPPERHGLRLGMALAALRVKPWPFPGAIGVRENGRDEIAVFDDWRYLGRARTEPELAELAATRAGAAFDPEIYRILSRYFSSTRRDHDIVAFKVACTGG